MGYSAYVWCNCYKEGKTEPYPFAPEFIFPDDPVDFDDPNAWPGKGTQANKWLETACEHRQFQLVSVKISDYGTMAHFKNIVESLGGYADLLAYLPQAADDLTDSNGAKKLLADMKRLKKEQDFGTKAVLVDSSKGYVAWDTRSSIGTQIRYDETSGYLYGVDHNGFYIIEIASAYRNKVRFRVLDHVPTEDQTELFRAKRFRRRASESGVEYHDLDSGKRFFDSADTQSWKRMYPQTFASVLAEYPKTAQQTLPPEGEVHLEIQPITLEPFRLLINGVKTVCKASIETGNPIIWC